jgi:hypothetical protein
MFLRVSHRPKLGKAALAVLLMTGSKGDTVSRALYTVLNIGIGPGRIIWFCALVHRFASFQMPTSPLAKWPAEWRLICAPLWGNRL